MAALSSKPAPSRDELVARAAALGPALRERAEAANTARTLPAETIADFQEAGFFRMLQPARWGGFESDPATFFAVQRELARACPSSAWVLGVVAVHAWQMALFPDEAQQEVWGDDPSTLVSSSYMPVGKVKRVEGGFLLSGTWGFSSGSDHCDWAFLGGFVPVDEGPPDMRTFLVPKGDYALVDDWHVMGLQATGSKTVHIDECFVPEHRTHKFGDGFKQRSPGHAENTAPLFRLPFGQIFVRSVSTGAIGMAQGALDAFLDVQSKRRARGDGRKVAADPRAQQAAADAVETIDRLVITLERDFEAMMALCEAGERIPLEDRIRYRYHSARVGDECARVIDALMLASGGSAVFLQNPLQRFFRDVHTARGHYANSPDKPALNLGGTLLGGPNTDFFL